jgi:uncharacterized protein YgbK (DUF1537 family)
MLVATNGAKVLTTVAEALDAKDVARCVQAVDALTPTDLDAIRKVVQLGQYLLTGTGL